MYEYDLYYRLRLSVPDCVTALFFFVNQQFITRVLQPCDRPIYEGFSI